MLKIAIDSRSANLHAGSGIGTYTKNLVLNLINNIDCEFELIWTGDYKCLNNRLKNTNVHLTSGRNNSFFELNYVPNLLKEKKVDLYHIPQNGIGFSFNSNLNTIVTIHDLIPYILPETVGKGYLERFLKDMPNIINNSRGIITVSEYSKKDILRFFPNYPADNIYVTPLAANNNYKPLNKLKCKEYISTKYKITDNFFLYIGGFSLRKNVKGLINAYMKINKDLHSKYKLVIIGSLKDEGLSLKEYVKENGFDNDVIFLGYIDDLELPIFYNSATAFIYPSLYEGFGLPPLEAMSCKCPVITSNISSIPEVTKNNALLIDPNDIDELAYSILNIGNNSDLREEFTLKGYNESMNYSWKKTASLTLKIYKEIINSKECIKTINKKP